MTGDAGRGLLHAGFEFGVRESQRPSAGIDEAGERIRKGDSVVIFPEGTRTRDGTLGPFKKGGIHLAVKAGVPIVPVALQGTRALMPRGSYLLRAGTVRAIIGQPIPTQGLSDEERAGLSERVRGIVEGMLARDLHQG